MLNQERVCEMTKLAIFDKNDGEECKPMTVYFRKDYIAKEMIKSLISGTMAFGALAVIVGVYCMGELMEQLNFASLEKIVIQAVLCYAVFMAVYFGITYAVYYTRYKRGRHKVKQYYQHLKKVNKLYREEEQD